MRHKHHISHSPRTACISACSLGARVAVFWPGIVAFGMLLAFVWWYWASPAQAARNPQAEYAQAKKHMQSLPGTGSAVQREPWITLSQRFYTLYMQEKQWKQRVAALYNAAQCMDTVARASYTQGDRKKALALYLELDKKFPGHVLADDALYQAAMLELERKGSRVAAKKHLERITQRYAKADHATKAREQLALLRRQDGQSVSMASVMTNTPSGSAVQKKTGEAKNFNQISKVTWTADKQLARVAIHMDSQTQWELRSSIAEPGSKTVRLVVELFEARLGPNVPAGKRVDCGVLNRVRFEQSKKGNSKILLDCVNAQSYSAHTEENGRKLVIQATSNRKALPGGLSPGMSVRSSGLASAVGNRKEQRLIATRHMASQLGLGVKTIVIDAGHGGKDPGTHHNGILERSFTLNLSQKVGEILKARGYAVQYTRTGNTTLGLLQRATIANASGDLFVSIHVNAAPNPAISGFETYYLDIPSSAEAVSLAAFENALSNRRTGDMEQLVSKLMLHARRGESRDLAKDVQKATLARLRKQGFAMKDSGVKSTPFMVLMESTMPGILIEAGYCTNKADAKQMAKAEFTKAMAQGIAEGVLAYVDSLKSVARR